MFIQTQKSVVRGLKLLESAGEYQWDFKARAETGTRNGLLVSLGQRQRSIKFLDKKRNIKVAHSLIKW